MITITTSIRMRRKLWSTSLWKTRRFLSPEFAWKRSLRLRLLACMGWRSSVIIESSARVTLSSAVIR